MRYKKIISILILIVILFSNQTFAQFSKYNSKDKPTIVVLDFKLITLGNITEREVLVLSSKFRSAIIKTNMYRVLERENVEVILKEHNFSLQDFADCTGGKCAIKLGGLLSAQKIIIGDIGRVGQTYSITAKIIDTSTGLVDEKGTVDEEYRGKDEGLIRIFGVIAKKLTGTFKPGWRWWYYVIVGALLGGGGYYGYKEFIDPGVNDNTLPEPPMP